MKHLTTVLIINIVFFMLGPFAFAECWTVSDFQGYATNFANDFEIHKDSLTSQTIDINIDGDKSTVTGSEGITFFEITPHLIVGIYNSGTYKGVVESWGLDIEKGKVFYTQTKSGYIVFDGAKMFVGKIVGKCKTNQKK